MRVAMYGGSFDPLTKGHEWVISEALTLFDRVLVVVCKNPDKKTLFTLEERVKLTDSICRKNYGRRVKVLRLSGCYLADFARMKSASHLIRGIRSASDLEVERLIRQVNDGINPCVRTLFLHPPKEFEEVSSSLVKSLVGFENWTSVVSKYVSPQVIDALINDKGFVVQGSEGG